MDKAHLDEEAKQKYRHQLEENEHQIEILKRQQYNARKEAEILRNKIMNSSVLEDSWEPSDNILLSLLNGDKDKLPASLIRRLTKYGYIDEEGNINGERIVNTLAMRRR